MTSTNTVSVDLVRELAVRYEHLLARIRDEIAISEAAPGSAIDVRFPEDGSTPSVVDLVARMNLGAVNRLIQELRDIAAARDRMRNGTYGKCVECAAQIPVEQLRARLTATRCEACRSRRGAPGEPEAYLEADEDIPFLNSPAARSVRLQLDFMKADLALREHGVDHTIVVFGSTRICEPRAAEQRVVQAKAWLAEAPADMERQRAHALALRLRDHSRYYEVARAFGRLVATATDLPSMRFVVLTGGGPGIMEAANRGAHDARARSAGFNISLARAQAPNPYVTPSLCFRFHYFGVRKLHFLLRARALVAFPGGYGTFDELFETLSLMQTGKIRRMPVVLVGETFWRRAFDADMLADEGLIDPDDRHLFAFAESAEDIWRSIVDWYANTEAPTPAGVG